ncbi:MAG: response regulator [bacterium]|nr:response regulator [bacterium]
MIEEIDLKVMLIDDDENSLKSIGKALSINGIDNRKFISARKAIEAYKTGGFDVVITDLIMPEMDGIDVLKTIREFEPGACVIILTASVNPNYVVAALNNKASAFILKPSGLEDLMNMLSNVKMELETEKEKADAINLLIAEYNKLKNAFGSVQEIIDKLSSGAKKKKAHMIPIFSDPVPSPISLNRDIRVPVYCSRDTFQ